MYSPLKVKNVKKPLYSFTKESKEGKGEMRNE